MSPIEPHPRKAIRRGGSELVVFLGLVAIVVAIVLGAFGVPEYIMPICIAIYVGPFLIMAGVALILNFKDRKHGQQQSSPQKNQE